MSTVVGTIFRISIDVSVETEEALERLLENLSDISVSDRLLLKNWSNPLQDDEPPINQISYIANVAVEQLFSSDTFRSVKIWGTEFGVAEEGYCRECGYSWRVHALAEGACAAETPAPQGWDELVKAMREVLGEQPAQAGAVMTLAAAEILATQAKTTKTRRDYAA